jgi:hypothetical protein
MQRCHDFKADQPVILPGPYPVADGAIAMAAIADERLNGGSEVRDIGAHGQGVYTDNGRHLAITLWQSPRAVDVTTWQAADVELFAPNGASIFATVLPSSVQGVRLESPALDVIGVVVFKAHSEFMLLSMCIES